MNDLRAGIVVSGGNEAASAMARLAAKLSSSRTSGVASAPVTSLGRERLR